ncbi:MAG: acyl-CoA dehydrogenase [Betaproteobacteria bacterium]|nr:MAG: acyl-CoA dehydrogenase [Betaproteobacteria bacterium]
MNRDVALPTDEERVMLRDSLRGFLAEHWPAASALQRAAEPAAVAALGQKLAAQGFAALGTNPSEGGLREIAIVMEELGRAGCPAPMLGAALANLIRYEAGDCPVSFAFAAFDHDPEAGAVTFGAGKLNGKLRFVEGAASATRLLVAVEGGVAAVDCAASGVKVTETRALGSGGLCEIDLRNATAALIAVPAARIRDLNLIARLCLHARAYGAARRAFEMAVEYAKERKQFGRLIGSFQAIQHKLANCLIALEGVRLTLANAASNHDRGTQDWRYFASAAIAFSGGALRQISLETHHAFGAIGYAGEHEAPRHFRRVHCDTVAQGGARQARREIAACLLDGATTSPPRYDLGAAGNAFRDEVRAWLTRNWAGERKAEFDSRPYEKREYEPSFARDLGSTGWIGHAWPKRFGGQERTPHEQIAFIEEMERVEAPRAGAAIQANALMLFGTPEQQAKYLPEIFRGEAIHGMGYSEPNAGSDLAALRTSARRDGDQWVINGQKIWTTTWWGQYMFLGARTDPKAKPSHAGISTFIVPMTAPGITIKPSKTMYDGSFANIFYDNVRLPADALLGEENGGWKVLTSALATERGLVGGGIVLKVARQFELLCEYVRKAGLDGKPLAADPLVRDRLATLAAEIEVGRQLMMECAARVEDGVTPPEYGAISKVFSGELMERLGEAALDILGMRATLSQGASDSLANGKFEQGLRHSLMWVISIGTNEIQRSLIAQRALELPK